MVEKVFGLWSKGSWEFLQVNRLEDALPAMEQQRVHVVVIDVYLPGKDGISFLRSLHSHFPIVPKMVLTDHATDSVRDECLANGALRYQEKPKTMERMEKVFHVINDLASAQNDGGFKGTIWVIGLHEVLQLECLHKRSSVLEISSGRYNGKVYIQDGVILHAE